MGSTLPSVSRPSLSQPARRNLSELSTARSGPKATSPSEGSYLLHGPARDATDKWFLRTLGRLARERDTVVWVVAQAPSLSRSRAASLPFSGEVRIIDMVSPVVGLGAGDPAARVCNGPTDYQQLMLHLEDLTAPPRRCLVVVDNLNGICYSDPGERVLRAMNSINNLVASRGGAVAYLFYDGCLPPSQEEALRSVVHRRLRPEAEGEAATVSPAPLGLDRPLLYVVSLTLIVVVLLTFLLVGHILR